MSGFQRIEGVLQKAAGPFPAPLRAWLRSLLYAAARPPVDSMRRKHANSAAMLAGLQELIDYVRERGVAGAAVEVGSYAGESTDYFARHFATMHAVDPWLFMHVIERVFDERMARHRNVTKWKMRSSEAAGHFADHSLDFVYIDADHHEKYVREDIRLWLPKIRPGGLLAGHDYSPEERGVRRAVDDLVNGPDRVFADTSWVKGVAG